MQTAVVAAPVQTAPLATNDLLPQLSAGYADGVLGVVPGRDGAGRFDGAPRTMPRITDDPDAAPANQARPRRKGTPPGDEEEPVRHQELAAGEAGLGGVESGE